MNTKIKEFIEQAHTYSFQENRGQFVLNDFAEKFAELIVKECIDVCANGWQGEFTAAGISQCVSDLREHFGVEE
jgi:hypothetical protein